MKLKIFGEAETVKEKEVYLKLVSRYDDEGVSLAACDKNGVEYPGGRIISIMNDGTLRVLRHLNLDLGFQLAAEDRIKESKGD